MPRGFRGEITPLTIGHNCATCKVSTRCTKQVDTLGKTLVFVYGSLRRGALHHAEIADARFVAHARTQACYELVDLGDYPALVEGGATAVAGELYEVGAALLAALDAFEEAPAVYQRTSVRLAHPIGTHAQAYVMPREAVATARRIPSGDWLAR